LDYLKSFVENVDIFHFCKKEQILPGQSQRCDLSSIIIFYMKGKRRVIRKAQATLSSVSLYMAVQKNGPLFEIGISLDIILLVTRNKKQMKAHSILFRKMCGFMAMRAIAWQKLPSEKN
jgi:hypothetical protein